VIITVDGKGNVIVANIDPSRSKVAGEGFQELSKLAKKAAFTTKFSERSDSAEQVGSMLFIFKLK
jgi:acyl CoA:acetate/3-ketoacid CoA transferase